MTTIYHHRIYYPYLEHHITTPRRAWYENPVYLLIRELRAAELGDHIAENGVKVKKTFTLSRGTEYKVCDDSGRIVATFKCPVKASEFVYGEELELIPGENRTAENS